MAKKKTEKEELKEEVKEETTASAPEEADPLREATLALNEAQKELEETRAKLQETEDRTLRILAEYDNFKKRTAKEKEELYFAAAADVIKKLLPVFDNLDRAQMAGDGENYRKGVEMIIGQFGDVLNSMDVHQIAKEGDEFDPVFHEAIFREEKEGVPENTITEVLQKGYAMGDKVIRHAMVKVSG
ncbi:MAG: nucleotide exchange factor GrpE [Clostridia bacterium]|nr:nucleotide exchange factor GrpE [Clostridia bacterium]